MNNDADHSYFCCCFQGTFLEHKKCWWEICQPADFPQLLFISNHCCLHRMSLMESKEDSTAGLISAGPPSTHPQNMFQLQDPLSLHYNRPNRTIKIPSWMVLKHKGKLPNPSLRTFTSTAFKTDLVCTQLCCFDEILSDRTWHVWFAAIKPSCHPLHEKINTW